MAWNYRKKGGGSIRASYSYAVTAALPFGRWKIAGERTAALVPQKMRCHLVVAFDPSSVSGLPKQRVGRAHQSFWHWAVVTPALLVRKELSKVVPRAGAYLRYDAPALASRPT